MLRLLFHILRRSMTIRPLLLLLPMLTMPRHALTLCHAYAIENVVTPLFLMFAFDAVLPRRDGA